MKRRILWLAATAVLAACGRGGGAGHLAEDIANENKCRDFDAPVDAAELEATSLSQNGPSDPFQLRGKVIIASHENPALMTDESDSLFPAGAELSVTLAENCKAGGEISSGLQPAMTNSAVSTTPSGVRSYKWKIDRAMRLSELKSLANGDTCVVGVADAVTAEPFGVMDDPLLPEQGHLRALHASEAYDIVFSREELKPVTIAVIDTGIEMKHDDLKGVLWVNEREIPGNRVDDDRNGYIDDVNGFNFALNSPSPQYLKTVTSYQHGTHVSGLAAAQGRNAHGGVGVMPMQTRIMMLNVFGGGPGASGSDIANAIRYAADNGADVINLSLGSVGRTADYESSLAYAIRKGVTVFAASGNDGREVSSGFFMAPGAYGRSFKGMISVGSVDAATGALSTFSNFGAGFVEMAAPGSENSARREGLLSTWPGNGYRRIQGTSMSTPVLAGAGALAIAMLRSRGYLTPPAAIESILSASARKVPALYRKIQSGSVLDLKKLVEYIDQMYPVRSGAPIDPEVPTQKCS